MSVTMPASTQVVIAVDPHKASWTAVAVDNRLQPLAAIRVEVNRDGYRQLRRFARRWPQAVWAVEGAAGLGAPLIARLSAEAVEVVDVPAKLARRVRMLSTGHGRKTDEADAPSVGIAAHTATRLNTAVIDEAIAALRALTEHRDDLVRTRTQTVNRLHASCPARPGRFAPPVDRRHGSRRLAQHPPASGAGAHPAPRRRGATCRGSPPRPTHR